MQISQESTCIRVFFITVSGPQNCTFTNKRLKHRCIPVKFAKVLRTLFLYNIFSGCFLVSSLQFYKERDSEKDGFLLILQKIFENNFWENTSGWLLVRFICEFWEVFKNLSFIEHLWKTVYFVYKLQNFNHYFTGAFQAFYTRTRSSHSKAFIYLKCLNSIYEDVNS